jgi:hypothetical protein
MVILELTLTAQIPLAIAIEVDGVGQHLWPRLLDPQDDHMRRQVVALPDLDQERGQGPSLKATRHVDEGAACDF